MLISTLYPSDTSDSYLKVATVRSPYTFNVEENLKSTRFITLTRTESEVLKATSIPSLNQGKIIGTTTKSVLTLSDSFRATPETTPVKIRF